MNYYGTEELWKRMSHLADQYELLQVKIQDLEDAIAEDRVGLGLLETEQRVNFPEMRDLYGRRMGTNQRKLGLLQEQLTENRLNFGRVQEQLASIQCRTQVAE